MRRIVHLSDLHFGRVNPALVDPLLQTVREVKPDIVAISGDLTQRARSYQFQQARKFLDALPKPQIVVPGNHDIPLHNLFDRFLEPLTKYRRFITDDLQPVYADEEMVIVGVNTARSAVFKGGRINRSQVDRLREKFCALGKEVVKAVVTHHPFDLPEGHNERDLVGRLVSGGPSPHQSHQPRAAIQHRWVLGPGGPGWNGNVDTRKRRGKLIQRPEHCLP
jgi:3',5'-cyclic AMP phosphodiesterase CpdA